MDNNAVNLDRVRNTEITLPEVQISNRYAGLKVFGMVADRSACGYYRVINPLHMLKMHGATIKYSVVHDPYELEGYDKIIVPRQNREEVKEACRILGFDKSLYYEIDDNLDYVLPDSPAFITYHQGSDETKGVNDLMSWCHGVTVTTPELKDYYTKNNTNIRVIENYIDFSFRDWGVDVDWDFNANPIFTKRQLERIPGTEGKVVIGYAAGSTHQKDLEVINADLKRIFDKYDDVMLALYTSAGQVQQIIRQTGIPEDRIVIIEPRHFLDYPAGLHGFDIGLAPLHGCEFNLGKSFLRCSEMSAVGAIPVASHVGPYARYKRRHPEGSVTVGKANGAHSTWFAALDWLLSDRERLAQMKEYVRDLTIDKYSLEKNFHLWPLAWSSIDEQVAKGNCGAPKDGKAKKTWGAVGRNDKCPCGSGKKYKACCTEEAFG